MAQARTREAYTDLPTAAVGTPAAAQPANTVTLPSGKTVKLRRLNGLDSSLLEQAMEDAGFVHLSGPGKATYIRCMTVYGTEEIDGALQMPPEDGAGLKARLVGFGDEDWVVLMGAYMKLAGMVPADATFQPAG